MDPKIWVELSILNVVWNFVVIAVLGNKVDLIDQQQVADDDAIRFAKVRDFSLDLMS